PASQFGGYLVKYYLDSALTQVVSGYPHPNSVFGGLWGDDGTDIPQNQAKGFLRTNQLVTFFGVTTISRGFWHLKTNQAYQEAIVFYNRLRNRLQQYAYDQAMRWYETGVPWLMQPLFIRWPSDPNSHSLYGIPAQANSPADEFMFGNALLIRPVFTDVNTVSVYLPAGKWKRFMQPNTSAITGPTTISYSLATDSGNASDYPIFLKEGEILVIGHNTNPGELWAYVFLDSTNSSSSKYSFHRHDGTSVELQATRGAGADVVLKRLDTTPPITTTMASDPYGKGFKIANLAELGLSY
ncbi:partial Alpha-xylosidase, partial [Anaerolineae bacterium]